MAFDPVLADRVRAILHSQVLTDEKHMFGGVCWMVDGKMCVGVVKDELMIRLDPATCNALSDRTGVRPMDFTGKTMKGFLFIQPEGLLSDADLRHWLQMALDYNPVAKRSSPSRKQS